MTISTRGFWSIAAVSLAGCVALSGCGSKEESKAKHMERGNAYFAQTDYDRARVEYRNVAQLDPRDAAAYFALGQTYERQGDWNQAFAHFSKVVELAPDHLEAKTKVGRIHLLAGDTAKADEQAQAVLAKRPDDPAARTLYAAVLARNGDMAGAIREARAVLDKNPADADAASLLAGVYSEQHAYAQGEQVLLAAVKGNPGSVALRLDLVSLLGTQKKFDAAEPLLREVTRLEPKKFQHRVRLAALYANTNRVDAAEEVLRAAIAAEPEDEQRYLALGQFLAEKRGIKQAEQELQKVLQERPKATSVRLGLATLYEGTGRPEQAEQTYRDVIDKTKLGPERIKARNQLARLLVIEGDVVEAGKVIADVLKDNPRDSDALVTRGRLALERNEPLTAIGDFRALLRDQPGSMEYLSLLARAHMQNQEPQLARENLVKAVEQNPNSPQARVLWANFLAQTKDFEGALKEVNEALARTPLDPGLLQLKAALLSAKNDSRGAEETLAKLKSASPEQLVGYYRLGTFYLSEKRYDEAIAEFDAALKKSPEVHEPLAGIVQAYLAQKKPEKALERLREVVRSKPSHPTAHFLVGNVLSSQGDDDQAQGAYRKAIEVNSKWNAPYVGLAETQLRRKDYAGAIRVIEDGLRASPGDPLLAFSLAQAHEASGDFDRAAAGYEALLKTNPGMDIAANNLASLLTDRRSDKASLERALELAKRFEDSSNATFLDTLGWIHVKLGQTGRGQAMLEKVVERAPEVPVFRYHLGIAYHQSGNTAGAKLQLQKATATREDYTGLEEARTLLARM